MPVTIEAQAVEAASATDEVIALRDISKDRRRVYVVPFEPRTVVVDPEDRTLEIDPEDRTLVLGRRHYTGRK
jgi:hypothetical protein